MDTIFWQQLEVFKLDYSDKFLGVIKMKLTNGNKLLCEVILEDCKNPKREDLIIGIIKSDKEEMSDTRFFGVNMLYNEQFCKECWDDYIRKDDK